MINLNLCIGGILFVLGVLCVLLSIAIGARKYVFAILPTLGVAGGLPSLPDIWTAIIDLLKEILKAPPALAFLVGGLILLGGGAYVLYVKPF
jgi:hypothetical protein